MFNVKLSVKSNRFIIVKFIVYLISIILVTNYPRLIIIIISLTLFDGY